MALFEFLFWKVEHHLWPAMSFVHLREASQILKSACKEFLGTEHRQSWKDAVIERRERERERKYRDHHRSSNRHVKNWGCITIRHSKISPVFTADILFKSSILARLGLPYHEIGYWEAYGKVRSSRINASAKHDYSRIQNLFLLFVEVWEQVKEHAEQPEWLLSVHCQAYTEWAWSCSLLDTRL